MKIVADIHIPFVREYFSDYGELILKTGRTINHDDVKDADILLVRSVTPVDEKLLRDTTVKFVGSVTAGADHLDTKWLDEAGIQFSVASGFNAPPVADYVVSIIAALQMRRMLARDKELKAVVIGVGNVGRLVVERLQWLGFTVELCDPLRAENEKHFNSISLQEITDADFITLHVPLTKTGAYPTFHFIDQNFLERQKPGCVLLNASRGSVIHSGDLLQYGKHLHWCIDVWEHEPKIDKKLLEMALIATPHIAGYSRQSKIRGIDMIYRIACEKGIIKAQTRSPLVMPQQQLKFAGHQHGWQNIVLGVFNPLVITEMMHSLLHSTDEAGHLFDEMRNAFNYRYEFAYTSMLDAAVSTSDVQLLKKLGLSVTRE